MTTEWNLKVLYKGLDDPSYEADVTKLMQVLQSFHELIKKAPSMSELERVEAILSTMENKNHLVFKLYNFVGLSQSVNTQDGTMMAQQSRLSRLLADCAADEAAAEKMLGAVKNLPALSAQSPIIHEYEFMISQYQKNLSHMLSNEEESMLAAMEPTAGSAWGDLQSYLTSTVKVDYQGKQVTLSEIRNLAYHADAAVRKEAYEAEIASYEKIQDSVAFALNNIKNQVTMLSKKRGYESPLAMTLESAQMDKETLDAMMESIREYLPIFRKYLKHKAKLLGHTNGLPFYDLFAPLGDDHKEYSLEDARDCLVEAFETFTPEMSDMIREAFDNEWIDFYPRNGKTGGAFCAMLSDCKQSRILTNYDGTFGSVDTLAHELGHAFHNRQIENERILNQDYPMPVAETASTFNEIHLCDYVAKKATQRGEKLALLENDLREKTQCIVDIYSRYLFETAVFEKSQEQFLMAPDLCEIMLDCQRQSYGDGLDPDCMHPYMWLCKGHYYSSGLSFYNFPYAFGNLFAQGLHALFEKQGEAFVPQYKAMLKATPTHSCEEDGAMVGIDLTSRDFWDASLSSIAAEIEEYCQL